MDQEALEYRDGGSDHTLTVTTNSSKAARELFKALQCLGARNYKPPTLKERSKWSGNFRNFVKLCLTKNERNRPDASTLLTHDFVANPSLSIVSTRELLNLKHTLEEREKAAFAASVTPAGAKIKVSAAIEPSSEPPPPPPPPPPIPQKMQQPPQPQQVQHHYPPSAAAEQSIWPVSVNRERPRSLMLLQDYQQQENRNGSGGNYYAVSKALSRARPRST
ncbi:hypothetical protein ACTXT7_015187 [Hymenolepis weldensis]